MRRSSELAAATAVLLALLIACFGNLAIAALTDLAAVGRGRRYPWVGGALRAAIVRGIPARRHIYRCYPHPRNAQCVVCIAYRIHARLVVVDAAVWQPRPVGGIRYLCLCRAIALAGYYLRLLRGAQ